MIVFITSELIEKRSIESNFGIFISNMMVAYEEGKHVIVISPRDVLELSKDKSLDERTKATLLHYRNRNKSVMQVLSLAKVFVKVVGSADTEEVVREDSIEIRKIKIDKFLDSANIQKTILLGENLSDSDVYAILSEYYLYVNSMNPFFLNSYEPSQGGGDQTWKVMEAIYKRQERFCICILDSDRRKPTAGIGGTAKKVTKCMDRLTREGSNYKCNYHILDFLEIENILPERFYQIKYSTDINKRLILPHLHRVVRHNRDIMQFFDFKKGIRCKLEDCKKKDKGYIRDFWCPLFQLTNIKPCDKTNYFIKGYGENILDDLMGYDRETLFRIVDEDNRVKQIWINLGGIISSYILGTTRIRAI